MKDRAAVIPEGDQGVEEAENDSDSDPDPDSEATRQPTTLEGERARLKSHFIREFGNFF